MATNSIAKAALERLKVSVATKLASPPPPPELEEGQEAPPPWVPHVDVTPAELAAICALIPEPTQTVKDFAFGARRSARVAVVHVQADQAQHLIEQAEAALAAASVVPPASAETPPAALGG